MSGAPGRERLTAQGRSKRLHMGPGATAARRPGGPRGGRTQSDKRPPMSHRAAPRPSRAVRRGPGGARAPPPPPGPRRCRSARRTVRQGIGRGRVGHVEIVRAGHPAGDHHRQKAPARSRATSRSPAKTPCRTSSAGPAAPPASAGRPRRPRRGAPGPPPARREVGRSLHGAGPHPLPQGIEPPQRSRQRPGRSTGPHLGHGVETDVVHQPHEAGPGGVVRRRPAGLDQQRRGRVRSLGQLAGSGDPPSESRAAFPSRVGRRGRLFSTSRILSPVRHLSRTHPGVRRNLASGNDLGARCSVSGQPSPASRTRPRRRPGRGRSSAR